MDMSSISSSLHMLQSSMATFALQKAMGRDAQSMATLISDMAVGVPQGQLAPKAFSLDISV